MMISIDVLLCIKWKVVYFVFHLYPNISVIQTPLDPNIYIQTGSCINFVLLSSSPCVSSSICSLHFSQQLVQLYSTVSILQLREHHHLEHSYSLTKTCLLINAVRHVKISHKVQTFLITAVHMQLMDKDGRICTREASKKINNYRRCVYSNNTGKQDHHVCR